MKITLRKLIDTKFNGDREKAANSAGMKGTAQLNNLISQGSEVEMLENGNFILMTKISKVFVVDNEEESKDA